MPYAALRALPAAVDNQEHSSGFLGFVVVFALAVAVYLLVRNLTGRLRRMNYRHEHEEAERAGQIVTGLPMSGEAGPGAHVRDETPPPSDRHWPDPPDRA
ncbi:MAG: hypothetical protein U0Q21_02900 [Dermatophilaceae bacterium]